MIYDTKTWEYPYLYNLIDQYRDLEKYNNGYAYNMMFAPTRLDEQDEAAGRLHMICC